MISTDQIDAVTAATAVGEDGEKIGKVGQVYLDDYTGEPQWVTVSTGFFGSSESFVPLDAAELDGETLRVPYTKETVKGAPRVAPDGHLDESEQDELYRYYQLGSQQTRTTAETDVPDDDEYATRDTSGTVGRDTSGPVTDDAMTRSEEQLHVGTERREAGRARLRKYVVTEQQTVTVPVSREEVRLEREPITDANVGAATDGPAISEEEHEVVLHQEVPVVEKQAVPVERVRLDTETVTEQQTVTDEVRKEQIDLDDDTTRPGTQQ